MPAPTWHYVVGDIHGCIDTLRALEDRIAGHAARHGARPFVVSAGDLIDRGPDSRAVVAHMRRGVAAGSHAVVPGNHDILLLECLRHFGPWPASLPWPAHLYTIDDYHRRGYRAARWLTADDHAHYRRMLWLSQGGYQTLRSYGAEPDRPASWEIDPEDLSFLLGLPSYWQNAGLVVSHALAKREDLEVARRHFGGAGGAQDLAELRAACSNLIWNRKLPDLRPDARRSHASGHTPFPRVRRQRSLGLVQVDTGCCFGRRLSAWCAETDEAFSVALRDEVDAG